MSRNICCERKVECCPQTCCEPCCPPPCCPQPCCPQPCQPTMTDCLAKEIECIWKQTYCDATIIPCIGMPSTAKCVMTLTHSMGKCAPKIQLNGLTSLSPLVNNGFYSAEVSGGQWLNLYQAAIPDIPGSCGCKSSGEIYTEALIKLGISIDGNSYKWAGSCPSMLAINSKAIGMNPCEFSKKQIAALKAVNDFFSKPCCCCK